VSNAKQAVRGRWRRHLPHFRLRPRWSAGFGIFIVLAILFPYVGMRQTLAVLVAFDVATVVFLSATALVFGRSRTGDMRSRSRQQDPGRWTVLWISLALCAVVLVALGVELRATSTGGALGVAVAAVSLLLSWLFMNTMFALHYAHAFYSEADGADEALEFPGTKEPDYWDFLYFAVVIGMTFQVSDVQIASRSLRRMVLGHSVIAFVFNVVIIAISVNVVAGKA
jgi:uncharacterized membrane protein